MIPLAVPNLKGNEAQYLNDCVTSTFVSSVGPFVDRFEKMVAQASGARGSVATSSGTTGLHLALIAVGVKPGDLVILPSFTFIASANAIAHCGAEPWLFDVDEKSWTLDVALLKEVLRKETKVENGVAIHTESGKRVAAVMPVYTLGAPADMDGIIEISRACQIPIVADAAAALGATYKGRSLGRLADLSVFSFNGNKTVTAGGGGAVAGNDQSLLKEIKHLSTTARVGPDYHHDRVGYNYRMTNLQAAVGCAQMEQLDDFVVKKRKIGKTYARNLGQIRGVTPFPKPEWGKSTCWFSGIVLNEEASFKVWEICALLKEKGVQARTFWKPIHLQPPYAKSPKTVQNVSSKIWQAILTLPCSTGLTEEEQESVVKVVKEILS